MRIAGIDPGNQGAIGFIDTQLMATEVYDMPLLKTRKSTGAIRTEPDAAGIARVLSANKPDLVFIELVWTSPQMGVVGAGTFMAHKYACIGVCAGLSIPVAQVAPKEWQKNIGCSADPKKAVARGSELFPHMAHLFTGPRGGLKDGRAEGLMIALYGLMKQPDLEIAGETYTDATKK